MKEWHRQGGRSDEREGARESEREREGARGSERERDRARESEREREREGGLASMYAYSY